MCGNIRYQERHQLTKRLLKVILPNSQVPLECVSGLVFSHYIKMYRRLQSGMLDKTNLLKK